MKYIQKPGINFITFAKRTDDTQHNWPNIYRSACNYFLLQ